MGQKNELIINYVMTRRQNRKNIYLHNLDLTNVNLSKLNLSKVTYRDPYTFTDEDGREHTRYRINTVKVYLHNSDLSGADLSSTNCVGANLKGANLTGIITNNYTLFSADVEEKVRQQSTNYTLQEKQADDAGPSSQPLAPAPGSCESGTETESMYSYYSN